MEELVIPKEKEKLTSVKIYIVISLCIQLFGAFSYVSGMATLFGKVLDISNAIRFIIVIFRTERFDYQAIMSTIIGIMYIIMLIRMIKSIIESFKTFKSYNAEFTVNRDNNDVFVINATDSLWQNFMRLMVITVACGLVNRFTFTSYTLLTVLIFSITFILSRIVIYRLRSYTFKSLITQALYFCIFFAALFLVLYQSRVPAIYDAVIDCRTFISVWGLGEVRFWTFIGDLSRSVMYFVITVITLKSLDLINAYVVVNPSLGNHGREYITELQENGKNILIVSFLNSAVEFIVYIINGGGITVNKIIEILTDDFSLISCAAAILFITNFVCEIKTKEDKKSAEKATENLDVAVTSESKESALSEKRIPEFK